MCIRDRAFAIPAQHDSHIKTALAATTGVPVIMVIILSLIHIFHRTINVFYQHPDVGRI